MFVLISGGSGSGKSAFAEKKLVELSKEMSLDERLYIATMQILGKEEMQKVERHRKLRAGKGFRTIECPTNIKGAVAYVKKESSVLLECMTNLLANEMFSGTENREAVEGDTENRDTLEKDSAQIKKEIIDGIMDLREKAGCLILITGEVFSDGKTYDDMTENYIHMLAEINTELSAYADEVYEVVAGIPQRIKG